MHAFAEPGTRGSLILRWTTVVSLSIWLTACTSQQPQNKAEPQPAPQAQQTQRFELKGKVVSIDKAQNKLVVDHEEIKGFMDAMTMAYPVQDANALNGLAPGDQVTAQVVVNGSKIWLENIVVVKKGEKTQ